MLAQWVRFTVRHAWPTLIALGCITIAAAYVAVTAFKMNSILSQGRAGSRHRSVTGAVNRKGALR